MKYITSKSEEKYSYDKSAFVLEELNILTFCQDLVNIFGVELYTQKHTNNWEYQDTRMKKHKNQACNWQQIIVIKRSDHILEFQANVDQLYYFLYVDDSKTS